MTNATQHDGATRRARRRLTPGRILLAALVVSLPASSYAADASADAEFASNFTAYDTVAEQTVPAPGAVDITAIEPAAPPPAQAIGGGMASYYGRAFAGRRTASGESFDPGQLTAAHRTLPFGSKVRVTSQASGRSVIVRINDRGPFSRGRVIDLSRAAAEQIGLIGPGHGQVTLELVES